MQKNVFSGYCISENTVPKYKIDLIFEIPGLENICMPIFRLKYAFMQKSVFSGYCISEITVPKYKTDLIFEFPVLGNLCMPILDWNTHFWQKDVFSGYCISESTVPKNKTDLIFEIPDLENPRGINFSSFPSSVRCLDTQTDRLNNENYILDYY